MIKQIYYTLIFLTFNIQLISSQDFNLAYKPEPGKKYTTEFITAVNISQTIMGIEQGIGMNLEATYLQEVNNINQNIDFNLSTKYRKIYINISSPFVSLEIDTDRQKKNDILSNIMSRLLEKPFDITLSSKGQIKDISGVHLLFNEIFDVPQMEENEKEEIKQLMWNNMGKESLWQNFSHFFCPYPDHSVKLNESWDIHYKLEQSDISFEFSGTGKIIEARPKTLLIRIEGTLNTKHQNNQENIGQQFVLNGNQVSEIIIDRESGWPIQSTINQNISGILHVTPPGEDVPMEIPMQMKMRMNIRSINYQENSDN